MAGKRENAMVVVMTDLTSGQARQITNDCMAAKRKYAPNSLGIIKSGSKGRVGGMLSGRNQNRIGEGGTVTIRK